MLRAVFFDIDDTLFSTSTFAARAREQSVGAMISMGVRCNRDVMLRELNEVIQEFTSNFEHHYDKLLSRLPLEATIGLNIPMVVSAGVVAYHETKFRELCAYDDVTEVLRILSETDLVLGVITNGLTMKQMEKLIRLQVHRFISPTAVFISDQVGVAKPNPKLYQRAVDRVGVQADEAIHVGDHPVKDVDAAKAVGMNTIWNCREGKYLTEKGATQPDHLAFNFWDVLSIIRDHYGIAVSGEPLR